MSGSSRRWAAFLVVWIVAVVGAGRPGVAVGDTAPPVGTPATVSADALPTWQINGVVWSQVVVNNIVYVTGSFSRARPPGVAAGGAGEVAATNIFAYDIRTGNRVTSFNHSLNQQGRVITAAPGGGRIYVGGDFTTVDGVSRAHIAAFDTASGALTASFHPTVNKTVLALAATAGTVFLGGTFDSVNSVARKRLAAVSAATGGLLGWAPTVDNGSAQTMVVAPDQSRVIVGGSFTTLSGKPAYGMGALNATTGAILPWAANLTIRDAGLNGAILSLRTDGQQIYGSGYAFGSGASFEGTFAAAPTTGKLTLVNDCHGDTYDVLPMGSVLYSVGHAHDCTWVGGFPDTNPRVRYQRALAQTTFATRTDTGPDSYGWNYSGQPASTILQWFPQIDAGTYTGKSQGAWSLAGNSSYVSIGGEFPRVNGKAQQGLVRMAVKASAPNKTGPTYTTLPARPVPATTATALSGGRATVAYGTAWDPDNLSLTYQLIRDNGTVVSTAHLNTNFWTLPTQRFTDSGLAPGSHFYQVRITDPFGNTLMSPRSNTITS